MKTFVERHLAVLLISALAWSAVSCSSAQKKEQALADAELHFTAGEYDKAEVEFLNVLKADAANVTARVRLGTIYLEQGRLARAFPLLREARDLQPGNVDARAKLGLVYLGAGAHAEAGVEANAILERDPKHSEGPLLLAEAARDPERIARARQQLRTLAETAETSALLSALALLDLKENQHDSAEALLQRAIAADSSFGPAYGALGALYAAKNDPTRAEEAFAASVKHSSARSPAVLMHARFRLQIRDAAGARQILEEAVRRAPDRLPAMQMLADVTASQRDVEASSALVKQILAREPGYLEAILLQARLMIAQGEFAPAIAELEKAAQQYPQAPMVQHQLGVAHALSGDSATAAGRFQQALALNPDYPEAIVAMAGINLSQGDPRAAINSLTPLVRQRPDLPVAAALLADAFRAAGQFNEALAAYQQLEANGVRSPYTLFIPGQLALQQNNRAEARQAFTATLERHSNFAPAVQQLAALDLAENKPDDALKRVQGQLDRTPNVASFHVLKAQILFAKNQPEQAEAALERAIELKPDESSAYTLLARYYASLGDQEKALAKLEESAKRSPRTAEGPLMITALVRESQRNYEAARDAYERLLAVNPRSGVALNNLSYLYSERLQDLERAFPLAQRAREAMPSDGSVADTLGWIVYQRGDYSRALTLLQESATKLPENATVQYHLGMAQYMLGNEDAARSTLERALTLNPSLPEAAQVNEHLALLTLDVSNPGSDARTKLQQALRENPNDPVALVRMAEVHAQAGEISDAINANEKARQASPQSLRPLINLARLHQQQGDLDRALESARAARRLNAEDPEIAHVLGRIALATGDFPWASSLLQEAARKQPRNPEILLDYAEAAYAVGRIDEARTMAQRASTGEQIFLRSDEAAHFLKLTATDNGTINGVSESDVNDALKRRPNYAPALMAQAALQEQRGDSAAALNTYERVLTNHPQMTEAQKRFVILAAQEQQSDRSALAVAMKAREAFPNDPELAKAVGIHLYRQNEFARAISLFEQSLRERGADAEAHFYLGLSQRQVNRGSQAKASLQRALELNLSSTLAAEAQEALASLE